MRRALLRGICLVAGLLAAAQESRAAPLTCDEAGAQVETAMQLPTGMLRAIGRVESGRRDPATGAFAPWPFTINANGQGQFFADAASAAAAVQGLRAAGTASIDVGCFQVNLMHHPQAFRRVEDGFDPAANAAYAGVFLQSLRQRLGNWDAAVAAYHSAATERGEAYRGRVFAAWGRAAAPATATASARAEPAPRVRPVVIRITGPDLSGPNAPIQVWTPSRPGSAAARIVMPALAAVAVADTSVGEP